MTKQLKFGEPDPEGFETLLEEPFIEYGGMIFPKTSYNRLQVESGLKTRSTQQVQQELNHIHLILYVRDIALQREWSERLKKVWHKRIQSEFPAYKVTFHQEDNGQDVIVTFWAEPRI